jgi:hypothetical protein
MDSTVFLLLSKSNSKIDGNRITFGAVDFQPHKPTLAPVFASLDQEQWRTLGRARSSDRPTLASDEKLSTCTATYRSIANDSVARARYRGYVSLKFFRSWAGPLSFPVTGISSCMVRSLVRLLWFGPSFAYVFLFFYFSFFLALFFFSGFFLLFSYFGFIFVYVRIFYFLIFLLRTLLFSFFYFYHYFTFLFFLSHDSILSLFHFNFCLNLVCTYMFVFVLVYVDI